MRSGTWRHWRRAGGSIRASLAILILLGVSSLPAVPSSAATLDRIRETGKMIIGYRDDSRPFAYKDEAGNPMGFSVELCQKVADDIKTELGLASLAIEWVPVTAETRFAAVEQGKVDIACGSATITLDRRKTVSFSIPIFPAGVAAMLRADAPKPLQDVLLGRPPSGPIWRASPAQILEHKTFSVVRDTTAETWLNDRIHDFHLSATVLPVETYEAGLKSVLDGTSHVFFGDRPILVEVAAASGNGDNVIVLDRLFTPEPIALVVPKNDDDFRLSVDRSLSGYLPSKEFRDVFTKWFGEPTDAIVTFFRQSAMPK